MQTAGKMKPYMVLDLSNPDIIVYDVRRETLHLLLMRSVTIPAQSQQQATTPILIYIWPTVWRILFHDMIYHNADALARPKASPIPTYRRDLIYGTPAASESNQAAIHQYTVARFNSPYCFKYM